MSAFSNDVSTLEDAADWQMKARGLVLACWVLGAGVSCFDTWHILIGFE
jgi:hypothetical protein